MLECVNNSLIPDIIQLGSKVAAGSEQMVFIDFPEPVDKSIMNNMVARRLEITRQLST